MSDSAVAGVPSVFENADPNPKPPDGLTWTSFKLNLNGEPWRQLTSTKWIVLHALFLLGLGFLWTLDEPLFQVANGFYNGSVPINGELHQLILSLKQYGQLLGIGTSLTLVFLFDTRHRGRVFVLGMMILAAGASSGLLKTVVGRTRPLQANGKTVINGLEHGISASRNQSFPSGHTATAVALSYGLSQFYPQGSVFFWGLAGGVALNRWLTAMHFPTDVLAGAWIGLVAAMLISFMHSVKRTEERLNAMSTPSDSDTRWGFRLTWRPLLRQVAASPWLLLVVSLAIHWAGNGQTPLWDRDEPRFATATREMAARGDWIVPTFNGDLRPDKPILIYWLMRCSYAVFGDGPFAARYISGLAGTLACLVVFRLGTRMFDRKVGLLAGWMLALSPMLIAESKLATVDALLLFFLTVGFLSLWEIIQGSRTWHYPVLLWSTLSLAILTKGPVAIGVLAVGVLLFAILDPDRSWLRRMRWIWGLAIVSAFVVPWCVAVQWATDGEFLVRAIGHHVLRRSVVPLENHRGFPGYYAVLLFGLMAPWAWMLPWSIAQHRKRWKSDRRLLFLVSWSVGNLVLFELVRTKLVHYYLPAYPALAILMASALIGRFGSEPLGIWRLDRKLGRFLVIAGTIPLIVVVGLVSFLLPIEAAVPAGLVAVTVFGGMAAAGALIRRHRLRYGFGLVASSMAVGFFLAGAQLFPVLGEQRVIVKVAERLREIRQKEAIALWHYCDPSLVYNLGKPVDLIDSLRNEPIFPESLDLARQFGRFICPMKPEQMELMRQDPNLNLEILESVTSFDLHGFKLRTIHLVAVAPSDDIRFADAAAANGRPNCAVCNGVVQPYSGRTAVGYRQASNEQPERH